MPATAGHIPTGEGIRLSGTVVSVPERDTLGISVRRVRFVDGSRASNTVDHQLPEPLVMSVPVGSIRWVEADDADVAAKVTEEAMVAVAQMRVSARIVPLTQQPDGGYLETDEGLENAVVWEDCQDAFWALDGGDLWAILEFSAGAVGEALAPGIANALLSGDDAPKVPEHVNVYLTFS